MNILNLSAIILFQCYFGCVSPVNNLSVSKSSAPFSNISGQNMLLPEIKNIILQSIDGGLTWQNISAGLSEDMNGNGLFVSEDELYISTGKNLYHCKQNSKAPIWKREAFLLENSKLASSRNGIVAYNFDGQFLQRMSPTNLWLPVYTTFQNKNVLTIYESTGGSIFIGCGNGLFKSNDSGKTWKQVQNQGWVMKVVESKDILVATSQQGIIRSTDDGESWELVINEGGVGIAIENIKGGFAAITYNTISKTRRVRTSYDDGRTWEPIDSGLRGHDLIASIKEVGNFFYCGHPDGIFRSSDKGKSWELILPSIDKKVFNLSVSGNVIYAIPRDGGC